MDADTLRLLLIVAGGLFLVGLYGWERRRARSRVDRFLEDDEPKARKREPRLGPWGDEPEGATTGKDSQEGAGSPCESDQPEGAGRGPMRPETPLVLSLHITPRSGVFTGEAIVQAAERCGIEPGEQGVFHRYFDPESHENSLFCVANMVKPGIFPFGAMAGFESPGLTLFAEVEGTANDLSRLETMLTTARCLATQLRAQIRDETRDLLTPEAEERMRDRVNELLAWRLTE